MRSHHLREAVASRPRSRFIAAAAVALGLSLAVFASPVSPAHAHDQLIDVTVETAEDGAAQALRLTFSDNVLQVGTEIHVTAPDGGDATGGLPSFSGRDVTQPFATPLADGGYTTVWRVVSSDGHPIEGGFQFDITDGTPGEVRPYTGEAETGADAADSAADSDSSTGGVATLPIAIGAAAVVAVAIAIPVIIRMRRGASPAGGKRPRDSEE